MKITSHFYQTLLIVLSCFVFVLGFPACQQEGTAEKAGQKVDAAKQAIAQQAEKTGAYIDESAKTTNGVLEKAGKQIDHAINQAGNQLENSKESVVDSAAATGDYRQNQGGPVKR